jgi:hypothetical protein
MTLRELFMFLLGAGTGASWGQFYGFAHGGILGGVAGFMLGAMAGIVAAPLMYGAVLLVLGVVYSPVLALDVVYRRWLRR